MNEMLISHADRKDLPAIRQLLLNNNLPADDVAEHLNNFYVATVGTDIVGTIGLEVYETSALLRSLAVAESQRRKGIAKSLYERLVTEATAHGIQEISLLTTTAEKYFEKLGFTKMSREEIPAYVKNTKEYRLFCPSNAACMMKETSR
ncbi:MAG: GNAT family N-acetyltransferase [Ignavibacteriales bacterium]|nr:GNAT family N-acetyltransferase [Ignavibacteriales bacterium]